MSAYPIPMDAFGGNFNEEGDELPRDFGWKEFLNRHPNLIDAVEVDPDEPNCFINFRISARDVRFLMDFYVEEYCDNERDKAFQQTLLAVQAVMEAKWAMEAAKENSFTEFSEHAKLISEAEEEALAS